MNSAEQIVEGWLLGLGKRARKVRLPTEWRALPDGSWYRIVGVEADQTVVEVATPETVVVPLGHGVEE